MESRGILLLRPYLSLLILVPAQPGTDEISLQQIVTEINQTQVAEDEILSDAVYYYCRNKDKILWIS